jgi:hypothetical protein
VRTVQGVIGFVLGTPSLQLGLIVPSSNEKVIFLSSRTRNTAGEAFDRNGAFQQWGIGRRECYSIHVRLHVASPSASTSRSAHSACPHLASETRQNPTRKKQTKELVIRHVRKDRCGERRRTGGNLERPCSSTSTSTPAAVPQCRSTASPGTKPYVRVRRDVLYEILVCLYVQYIHTVRAC